SVPRCVKGWLTTDCLRVGDGGLLLGLGRTTRISRSAAVADGVHSGSSERGQGKPAADNRARSKWEGATHGARPDRHFLFTSPCRGPCGSPVAESRPDFSRIVPSRGNARRSAASPRRL